MWNTADNPAQHINVQSRISILNRIFDLIISALGLVLSLPVFLIIATLVKLSTTASVFCTSERVGQGGRHFKLIAFRMTYLDTGCWRGPEVDAQAERRTTRLGHFLRATRLDSIPQLINVLRGDMSLVGPLPEEPRFVALYTLQQRQVLAVRPGLVTPALLHFRGERRYLSDEAWESIYTDQILPHRLDMELAYLESRTLWTDILLLLRALVAFVGHGLRLGYALRLRSRHFVFVDTLALLFIPAVALTLHLDRLDWWPQYGQALALFTLFTVLVKVPTMHWLGLHRRYWRYAGINDMAIVMSAVGFSTLVLIVVFSVIPASLGRYPVLPRTLPLTVGMLTALTLGGVRFGMRSLYYWYHRYRGLVGGRRVLVVGAGEAGTMVVNEMRANPQLGMEPVAFVDDDLAKVGNHIQDLPVLGTSRDILRLVDEYRIQHIIVATPSVPLQRQHEIVTLCEKTGVATHSLPGVYEILAGHQTVKRLPQVDLNHLLRRPPVVIEQTEVAAKLKGATVLVTGAGGSIGSELCRQIARFDPAGLILLGHGENSIFQIGMELRRSFPDLVALQVIADVRDRHRVNAVIEEHRPDVIFHAAAHKHVPFMEASAGEAFVNNVIGTWNVLGAAESYGVGRFVMISSDKAVNPTSIMGMTKRLGEWLVVAAARRSGHAYMAVRFGNVLGSRGSVVPIFQQQIASGQPLTITHPDMVRFFMTIPEAVQLVLQASHLGQGGEIFVLDMGQPVRILDLANDLIKLSGLEPERDIKIVYSGIRPGEKLWEELFLDSENYQRTKHQQLFVTTSESGTEADFLEQVVMELIHLSDHLQTSDSSERMRLLLRNVCYYIDQYHLSSHSPSLEPVVTPKALPSSGPLQTRPVSVVA